MDHDQSELVRQNAFTFLSHFSSITQNPARLELAGHLQKQINKKGPSRLIVRIAYAAGVIPYLKQSHLKDYFVSIYNQMVKIGHHWIAYASHGELLRNFKDIGGLKYCPEDIRKRILKWLVLTYIGGLGGQTRYGNVRHVFYSDTAAPLIEELVSESSDLIRDDLIALEKDKNVKRAILYSDHLNKRFKALIDIVSN